LLEETPIEVQNPILNLTTLSEDIIEPIEDIIESESEDEKTFEDSNNPQRIARGNRRTIERNVRNTGRRNVR